MGKKGTDKPREPSLFRKLIDIYFEQCRRRKVLRLLQKQGWSFDFLAVLLVRASEIAGKGLSLTVTNREGVSFTLTYDAAKASQAVGTLDDSIFNHLDDEVAVSEFIRLHSRK